MEGGASVAEEGKNAKGTEQPCEPDKIDKEGGTEQSNDRDKIKKEMGTQPCEPAKMKNQKETEQSSDSDKMKNKRGTKQQCDPDKMKATKVTDFSVRLPDDGRKPVITGIQAFDNRVVIADTQNKRLKVLDLNGSLVSAIDTSHVWGIGDSTDGKFVTCRDDNKIPIWRLSGDTIVSDGVLCDVDHDSCSISSNGEYYCVLHNNNITITVLDAHGKQVRKVTIEEAFGKKIRLGWDLHMDRNTSDIYVVCHGVNRGILCLSVDGTVRWFAPLDREPNGISEINGILCVTDEKHVHLLSKAGQYIKKLVDSHELTDIPRHISYDKNERTLFISFTGMVNMVSVFSLEM